MGRLLKLQGWRRNDEDTPDPVKPVRGHALLVRRPRNFLVLQQVNHGADVGRNMIHAEFDQFIIFNDTGRTHVLIVMHAKKVPAEGGDI